LADNLVKSLWINAPLDVVRSFFIISEKHAKWSGVAVALDPRPGGIYQLDMGKAGKITGRFLIVESQHIRQEIDAPNGGEPSTIDIRLYEETGGTRLVVEHSGLAPPFDEIASRGWDHHLARLSVACGGGSPGPDLLCERTMLNLS